MYCVYCGTENKDSAKFCRKCGKSTAELISEPADRTPEIGVSVPKPITISPEEPRSAETGMWKKPDSLLPKQKQAEPAPKASSPDGAEKETPPAKKKKDPLTKWIIGLLAATFLCGLILLGKHLQVKKHEQILSDLQQGNYEQALDCYHSGRVLFLGKSDDDIQTVIDQRAKDAYTAYNNGQLTYAKASERLAYCASWKFDETTEYCREKIEELNDKEFRKLLTDAKACAKDGDYYRANVLLDEAQAIFPTDPEAKQLAEDCKMYTLCTEDGYTIVQKTFDSYLGHVIKVGVYDENGNWIVPLSEDFVFAKAIQQENGRTTLTGGKTSMGASNICYLGEGSFVMSLGLDVYSPSGSWTDTGGCYSVADSGLCCYFFNAETKAETTFDAVWITKSENGKMLMYNSRRYNSDFYAVDSYGKVTQLPVRHEVTDYDLGMLSEGWFFANGSFYSIDGTKMLDLTRYAIVNAPYFVNGECEIQFKNNGGVLYTAVIDKQGNFVVEPYN